MTKQAPQQPVKEYKAGPVSAACWRSEVEQDGRTITQWSVKIQKQYKEKQSNDWKSTNYYFASELADLVLVTQRAFEYIRLRESEDGSDLPTVAV